MDQVTERHGVKVVAVRTKVCPEEDCDTKHVVMIKLDNGGEISSSDAMSLMDVGVSYFMIPPPGAPAYEAHKVTGLPLLLQTRVCPDCKERVLFA